MSLNFTIWDCSQILQGPMSEYDLEYELRCIPDAMRPLPNMAAHQQMTYLKQNFDEKWLNFRDISILWGPIGCGLGLKEHKIEQFWRLSLKKFKLK